jgi:hypothetical protein
VTKPVLGGTSLKRLMHLYLWPVLVIGTLILTLPLGIWQTLADRETEQICRLLALDFLAYRQYGGKLPESSLGWKELDRFCREQGVSCKLKRLQVNALTAQTLEIKTAYRGSKRITYSYQSPNICRVQYQGSQGEVKIELEIRVKANNELVGGPVTVKPYERWLQLPFSLSSGDRT